jgi:UDP-3-O-[3-hydroxymyristoyl] glucosamine N-acyltransferase
VSAYTLEKIASLLKLEFRGNPELVITGLASLERAGPASLSFYHNPRYRKALDHSSAGAVIIDPRYAGQCRQSVLLSSNPYLSFAEASALFVKPASNAAGIHPSAHIDATASVAGDASVGPNVCVGAGTIIESRVRIGANCVIGAGCRIGSNTVLYPNVTLYDDVTLGSRCIIHSTAVLGADGFGFASDGARHVKIHQLGGVEIGNDVEIGAGSTVDRGAIENTVVSDGVKIDNQVQIAHNVRIGESSIICGCSAIAGSSEIGKNCIIAGAVGIINHVRICDGVTVTAMSLVSRSINTPGIYSSGTGLSDSVTWKRNIARFSRLDEMWRKLAELEGNSAVAIDDTPDPNPDNEEH